MRAALLLFLAPVLLSACATAAAQSPGPQIAAPTTQELIAQYQADRGSLGRLWSFPFSTVGLERKQRLQQDWLDQLEGLDYGALDARAQIDWHLLRNMIEHDLESSNLQHQRDLKAAYLVPFVPPLVAVLEAKSRREEVDPREMAEVLTAALEAIKETRTKFEEEKLELSAPEAQRVSSQLNRLRRSLQSWVTYRDGYDPVFTWWCSEPWSDLSKALDSYSKFISKDLGGIDPNDQDRLIGNPIGREALLAELAFERIAYTPEELLEIAQSEFEWCMNERKKAANEMGSDGDWRAAQEAVKKAHPEPGGQPTMIHFLAEEAIKFLEDRDLMTIPELAKESWRMQMMTPERQKFSPYFTGGEVISISYPTDTMSHEAKLMTMRGNNYHYSRATVQHELIPGHHLQGYMADRWAPHRQAFYTPFLVEGWALYWEMRLWDLGFPTTPEDKIGMLFWRTHRCARIMFSLNFHLGNWTPEECVDFLVENVGHERRNATAEVRRSIQGGYGPLYQAAYMLGGLQILSLHRDLVEGAGWGERDFHDAILRENSIPVEYVRAALKRTSLPKDNPPTWRFYH
ncbi:MAG: DUF885 domain-containing protein [Planctomycetes bacterium]|nr:DUF885 domain-containing protein [Planctomycetota bacterium]MCP4770249.1 DUF885 domain-containing protein [Planctomycetota bacterium]MCP4860603.1 DUF885 domain-containing protein [Planctomycetota bacterium]